MERPSTVTETTASTLGIVVTLWATVRWLFWPRIQTTIRTEVDLAMAARWMQVTAKQDALSASIEHLTAVVTLQGEHTAWARGALEILVDRRSGLDRRRAEEQP